MTAVLVMLAAIALTVGLSVQARGRRPEPKRIAVRVTERGSR